MTKPKIELGAAAMKHLQQSLKGVEQESAEERRLRTIREWMDEHKWSSGMWLKYCAESIAENFGNVHVQNGVVLVSIGDSMRNKAIIHAMKDNAVLWSKVWRGSMSGGVYIFATSEYDPNKTQIRVVIEDN